MRLRVCSANDRIDVLTDHPREIGGGFTLAPTDIVAEEQKVRANGLPADAHGLRHLKQMGFSDARLAELANSTPEQVMALRRRQGVTPVYKRVDTCAAEFDSRTPYMYSTYEWDGWEATPGAAPL